MQIENKAAVVTGGASGLGAATAQRLAKAGARVTIFDRNEEAGEALARSIGGYFQPIDVTDDDRVAQGFEAAAKQHGIAQILVNCAGITLLGTVADSAGPHSLDVLRKIIEINLIGSFICLARFAAPLIGFETSDEERGVAINTASIAAFDASSGLTAYAASKGGVVSMTLPAARDLAKHRIRVMTIAPGMFHTAMVTHLPQEVQASLGRSVPFPNRLGHANEYAALAQSIVENSMLNGTTLRLDGAYRLPP